MGKQQKNADRIENADAIVCRTDASMCAECGEVCWHVEVWVHASTSGTAWKACLIYRDHLEQHVAITVMGRFLMSQGSLVQERAAARWLVEHQPSLW